MYNWRLLLLALVAILQPIASFTERNVVDGRQGCCGRETDSLLRDSKSSLHATHKITKEISAFRRVNDRDETREDRRYEIRQRDTVPSRGAIDSSHHEFREGTDRRLSNTARSGRVQFRSANILNNEYRDHRLDVQRRERNAANKRNLKFEEQYHRNSIRISRSNDRINVAPSRKILSRADNRISRINIYEAGDLDSQKERVQVARDLQRLSVSRVARDNVRQMREDATRTVISSDNRKHNARERIMTERRNLHLKGDERRFMDGERLHEIQLVEQRRSLSENVVVEPSRNIVSRADSRISRITIYEARDLDSQRERVQVASDLRRLSVSRVARDNVRQMREDATRTVISSDNRQHIARERIMTERRNLLLQGDERRVMDGERRHEIQLVEQRRSLSESVVVERNHDIRMRDNSRHERQENRNRISSSRRLMSERIEDNYELRNRERHSRRQTKENRDQRLSDGSVRMERREAHGYRQKKVIDIPASRIIESRRDIRYHEKLPITTLGAQSDRTHHVDSGRIRPTVSLERDNRVADQRARTSERGSFHNIRDETESKSRLSDMIIRERDESQRQIEYRNRMANRERDIVIARSQNAEELSRHRDVMFNKIITESNIEVTNWQYILYTLQAAYLCALLMQLLTPSYKKKSRVTNVCWWPLPSQELVKVD